MRLEQVIRSTMTEAMDMDGRLDQLVRAGLMPTSSLPLLKRAISRMHAGMSLQGAERDVMNMFISSMMFIVLGDDTVFNKARAGAKGYATEETELDENAPIVAHLTKRYGDNIRKSHVMSAAKDFGVDPSKLSKAVRKKLGKSMLDEAKDKQEYDYEGDMAMSQLKSIIANSQQMHDMLSEDTNLPEWVQSKITLAEDYITTASNYMQGEMNESKDGMPFEGPYRKVGERKDKYGNPIKNVAKHLAKKAMNDFSKKNEEIETIDELSKGTMGRYINKAATKMGSQGVTAGLKIAADEKSSKNFKDMDKREKGIKLAVSKLTKEEVDQIDELSDTYSAPARVPQKMIKPEAARRMASTANRKNMSDKDVETVLFNQGHGRKSLKLINQLRKEEVEELDELSKGTMGRYINKAKDSIDMTSYRSGIKDGTAISSSTPYKSNNPLEKKLSKRHKGIETAVKKLTKEEIEQIDELSHDTLRRYRMKAKSIGDNEKGDINYRAKGRELAGRKTYGGRMAGIEKAKVMAKEDIDAVKKMNESYKTAFETALNEYGIKSPSELDESKRKEFFNHVDLEFKKGDN